MSGLHVNTSGLYEDVIIPLYDCKDNLENAKNQMEKINLNIIKEINFNSNSGLSGAAGMAVGGAIGNLEILKQEKRNLEVEIGSLLDSTNKDLTDVSKIIEDFTGVEAKNLKALELSVQDILILIRGNKDGNEIKQTDIDKKPTTPNDIKDKTNSQQPTNPGYLGQDNIQLQNDQGIQSDNPTEIEELNKEQVDIELEENVPDTQVEKVIELIYGENPNLSEEQKQRIVEAIAEINKTEILEGLYEDIANKIRSLIVEDYLEEKLDLIGITEEDLQQYIDSQPSIKIYFELNEAIKNFENLIENGLLTEEEIRAIIEEHVEIYDSEEEFMEAYINAGGTETDVSEIESFYDPEDQKVHIRNTVDSETITFSIITILGDIAFYDEENGQVSYYTDIDGLGENSNVNMSDNANKTSSTNNVKELQDDVDAIIQNISTETSTTTTKVEELDEEININRTDNTEDISSTNTNVEDLGSDTTIEMNK